MIRVLLVDDFAAFHQPFALLIEREPDLTVVGQVGSVAEVRDILPNVVAGIRLDVACVDLDLPDGVGLDVIRTLRVAAPTASAVVLTADADPDRLADAVEAGAAGLIHKSRPIADVIAAVRSLGRGEPLLAPRQPSIFSNRPPRAAKPTDRPGRRSRG